MKDDRPPADTPEQQHETTVPDAADTAPGGVTDAARDDAGADDSIAQRAYRRFEQRGREHGHDVDDWLEAERDLTGRKTD